MIPRLLMVAAGSLLIPGRDPIEAEDSVGDDGAPVMDGGADVLVRRCDIVPITVVALINGA